MTKTLLLITATMISLGCINANAIEKKYYSNCKEYYDFQGFYHNECEEDKAKIYYKNINTNNNFLNKAIDDMLANNLEPKKEPVKEEPKKPVEKPIKEEVQK
ncbi:hypothetical protein [Sulfurimonas sp.]|uniref:hypothetical protein n=1 Tax=Sulfurimonas sp. TaxID=2022749 RepID=UPI0025F4C3C3|nr:hypothetical protein [Sulfurimonas sp.]